MARYHCLDDERRAAVAEPGSGLNGIDFLEVVDGEAPSEPLRQQILLVRFLKGPLPAIRGPRVTIDGGVRIGPVRVLWAYPLEEFTAAEPAEVPAAERAFLAAFHAGDPARDRLLAVRTDSSGDYSTYRLSVRFPDDASPDLDPRLAAVDFSFKVECPTDFDCAAGEECPPEALDEPRIDYLAKDYASFRRLMFDRIAALAPDWRERNAADLGVALVELLAYAGDRLSYFQDAVATEAYLGTARQRPSVRRHARLVDYPVGEGASARAWVRFEAGPAADGAVVPGPDEESGGPGTRLATRFVDDRAALPPESLAEARRSGALVFETLFDVTLRSALDRIPFYTWGDRLCCLPAGATEATLRAPAGPGLEPGALLLFEEVLGPATGEAADADPAHRHVVRLVRADPTTDPLDGSELVEIAWHPEDALHFPLCISSRTDAAHGERRVDDVSVARGNLVLADHGLTLEGEALEPVPENGRRYRPRLAEGPLSHSAPLPEGFLDPAAGEPLSAARAVRAEPGAEVPAVVLRGAAGEIWRPRRDLLASDRFAREMVAEIDNDGRARLRFGDGVHGRSPAPGAPLAADYRVGQGPEGNVGSGALAHVFTRQAGIRAVTNPLPASGGRAPESLTEVRSFAPQAFRRQQRAVTAEDYAEVAERHPEVERAAATFRWTGSWYTVFLTADRRGGLPVDAEFEERLRRHLGFYRMAGYDLEIDGPRFVPLEIELTVCVDARHFRSDVRQALVERFSSRTLPDGGRGFFHPDLWTFGQPVLASPIYAAAAGVEGVSSVEVTRFKRWRRAEDPADLERGELAIERLEIARLDNDPNFPENGVLRLELGGGR